MAKRKRKSPDSYAAMFLFTGQLVDLEELAEPLVLELNKYAYPETLLDLRDEVDFGIDPNVGLWLTWFDELAVIAGEYGHV